jgi:catechol 2,3-dioxygenase
LVAGVIDPSTSVGGVHLTIADLTRSVRFYETQLGFAVQRRDDRTAWLGAGGPDLLILSQSEDAPRVRGTTGLYHFAILVPSRVDLARALRHLTATRTVLQGAADHGVSESLYLADPDGNGIEIYRDRPRDQWPIERGHLRMGTEPFDFDGVLAEAVPSIDTGALARGTTIGHVHLRVANLEAAERFYVGVLGFELTQRFGPGALFVSAGGYHHHLGLNTWESSGAAPPPPGAIGLHHFELQLRDPAAVEAVAARVRAAGIPIEETAEGLLVRDPAQNAIALRATPQ